MLKKKIALGKAKQVRKTLLNDIVVRIRLKCSLSSAALKQREGELFRAGKWGGRSLATCVANWLYSKDLLHLNNGR